MSETDNLIIEINPSGVVQVKGDIENVEFFRRMAPAIEQLDLNIQAIANDAAAQAEVVSELTEILQRAPHLEQIAAATKNLIQQADQSFLDVLSAK
jgi:hypothetical protein